MATATGRQATARLPLTRPALIGRAGAWESRSFIAALTIGAAIIGGMALGLGPLTMGGALAALGAALVSPPTGLAVFGIMAPLKPPTVIPAPGFNTLLVGALLLGCVYRLPMDRPRLRPAAALLLLLGFVLYVSVQQLPDMLSGYAGSAGHLVGYQFIQLLTNVGLVLAASYVLRSRPPYTFLGAVFIGAVVAAVVAIGTSGSAGGLLANLAGQPDAASRAVGPFGDPNYFGLFMATAIATAVAWLTVSFSRRLQSLLAAAVVVLALALALSLSRAALVALLAGVLSLAFAHSRRAGLVTLGAAFVLAVVVYPLFVDWRLSMTAGGPTDQAYAIMAQSDQSRVEAALASLQLFGASPLFGVGFGHFSLLTAGVVGTTIAAHDWYLNVLAEEGIVGVALLVPMILAVAVALHRSARPARLVGYAVLATYGAGCLFLEPPNSVQTSALAVIVVVAALLGDWLGDLGRSPRPDSGETRRPLGQSPAPPPHPGGPGRRAMAGS